MLDVRALASVLVLLLGACATVRDAPPPQIAITIDDLPVHGPFPPGVDANAVNAEMIASVRSAGVPGVYGFINGRSTETQPETRAVLEQWSSAGIVLANHGWAHRHLNQMSIVELEEEVRKNEPLLGPLGRGTDWRWFRYPFLDEGETPEKRAAARQVLDRRGYRVAAVSMDFSDWQWTAPYARCVAAGDTAAIAELERLYLKAAKANIAWSRNTAKRLYGRAIPHVLLLHVSAMSARMMPRLIGLYRDAGFRFISLPEAQRDSAYRAYTDLSLPAPLSVWELAARKGVRLPQPRDHSSRLAAMCAGGGPTVPTP
jgi:peptidoglycan/xylan/chitin deacetylase (PgdA/CDA1 family)